MDRFYSIDEISERTGLSKYTLRYYEKENLIKRVARDSRGYRIYSEKNLEWITFLLKVKKTDMSIEHLKKFADLMEKGEYTIPQRKVMLLEHRKHILQEEKALNQALEAIDEKLTRYDRIISHERAR
ncbi:MerR family transcriptional regulator [Sporolactobacillus pectinivorans]|uniref:MerR family transcriptional regulator n=1 Tax=Sporolactobacillus pectinivorans TaxID=1591408 RepID=UPI0012FD897C|nr:MerR family transcriptional regulator [Sporolactobacillus pectinivorans]